METTFAVTPGGNTSPYFTEYDFVYRYAAYLAFPGAEMITRALSRMSGRTSTYVLFPMRLVWQYAMSPSGADRVTGEHNTLTSAN